MKKIVISIMLIINMSQVVQAKGPDRSSERYEISAWKISGFSVNEYFREYCQNGFVWLRYDRGDKGSYTQVLENTYVLINGNHTAISSVKTCPKKGK